MKGKGGGAARAAGFLLVWAVILFTLAAAVYAVAADGEGLSREMLRYAPPAASGLPAAEYPGVGRMISDYLTGKRTDFQYRFTGAAGETFLCFQPHEADHMADCRHLFSLAGALRWVSGGLALVFAGAGILLRRNRKAFANGMLTGLAAAGVLCLAVLVWGAADFDGLFTAFHRLAFTNDGWLLDVRTDLLIRLMPTGFFTALAMKILVFPGIAGLLLFAAASAVGRKNKTEGERPENP